MTRTHNHLVRKTTLKPLAKLAKRPNCVESGVNEFNCFMMLLIRPGSVLKFKLDFGFNECLRAIFSLLSFENF